LGGSQPCRKASSEAIFTGEIKRKLSRLDDLIDDPQQDAVVRDKNVKDALASSLEHQLWEKAYPGELWDAPKK
jgi:hypothetical protein